MALFIITISSFPPFPLAVLLILLLLLLLLLLLSSSLSLSLLLLPPPLPPLLLLLLLLLPVCVSQRTCSSTGARVPYTGGWRRSTRGLSCLGRRPSWRRWRGGWPSSKTTSSGGLSWQSAECARRASQPKRWHAGSVEIVASSLHLGTHPSCPRRAG